MYVRGWRVVLDGQREAMQRAELAAISVGLQLELVQLRRSRARARFVQHDDGVNGVVLGGDAGEERLQQLSGGYGALFEQGQQLRAAPVRERRRGQCGCGRWLGLCAGLEGGDDGRDAVFGGLLVGIQLDVVRQAVRVARRQTAARQALRAVAPLLLPPLQLLDLAPHTHEQHPGARFLHDADELVRPRLILEERIDEEVGAQLQVAAPAAILTLQQPIRLGRERQPRPRHARLALVLALVDVLPALSLIHN